MTTSLAALFVLLTATTDPTPAAPPAQDRTVEVTITGPETARTAIEEAVRTLIGDHPDLRWTSRERAPDEQPLVDPDPASKRRIWVDIARPIAVHVYLPGCSSNGSESVRTVASDPDDEAGVVERETVAQIVKGALEGLHCGSGTTGAHLAEARLVHRTLHLGLRNPRAVRAARLGLRHRGPGFAPGGVRWRRRHGHGVK